MPKLPPPPLPPPPVVKFQFEVRKSSNGQQKDLTYAEEQKEQLIKDIWVWLHEPNELKISIKKKKV